MKRDGSVLMKYKIYYKKWGIIEVWIAEALLLLNLIKIVVTKSYQIMQRGINLFIDNNKM